MATFNFQLANPRIYLSAEEDYDEWSMSFDATIEGPGHGSFGGYKAFKVICGEP